MRRIIFFLFSLLHTKITIGILVQHSPQLHNAGVGYIYDKPSIPSTFNSFKPIFPTYQPLQSSIPLSNSRGPAFSPLSFHPTSSISTLQSSNHFHPGHLPQSIHFDIPPAALHNFLTPEDNIYYANDGRILKQYEVMERILNDLEHPGGHILGQSSLFFDSLVSKFVAQNPSLAGQILQPVTRNHGPIALGSGSLGYIQLANGVAHLGSGSLGYITGQQASQAVIDAKTRKPLSPPGPLHFGNSFVNY